jgi:hypothetical protein
MIRGQGLTVGIATSPQRGDAEEWRSQLNSSFTGAVRSAGTVLIDGVRCELAPFYIEMGRSSIDPELMIRMPIVGCCLGVL